MSPSAPGRIFTKDIYKPTAGERLAIRPKPDMLKVSGDFVFATLQGEGVTAGEPAVFLRLHFCNLSCSWCDTTYTWDTSKKEFWKEPVDWSLADTVHNIEEAWDERFGNVSTNSGKRVVITGGEPLLQQSKIADLLKMMPDWNVEIETNGTITPLLDLQTCQINCSPKLENSGNQKKYRYHPDTLRVINRMKNSWFKFVVTGPDDVNEINEIIQQCNLDSEKILVMPEGYTLEATEAHSRLVAEEVKRNGWKIAKRHQLEWFGTKRRT